MQMKDFFIDKYPVTNEQCKKFLDVTKYHPRDDLHFLFDWKNGTYAVGWENKPVTWVSLEDARAYAAWSGKRLPHEWEWQFAAQGSDGRIYPWGNKWKPSAVPTTDKAHTMRGPDAVSAHPEGAGPFGGMDLVGKCGSGSMSIWTSIPELEFYAAAIINRKDRFGIFRKRIAMISMASYC
jgi:formylglycine-generating enzyme required for sulfatase activity